jgi:fatty acid desaturase
MAYRRLEGLTLALICACYAMWVVLTLMTGWVPVWVVLPLLAVISAFHTSLQHEALHGHPTHNRHLNEALVFLPLILILPYRRYRDLHLKHHNDLHLTDPLEDPESFFLPEGDYHRLNPVLRILLEFNNTFVGRMLVGPGLSMYGFIRSELRLMWAGNRKVQLAWLLHIVACVPLVWWIVEVASIPIWIYLLFVSYPAMALVLVRSFAEHQASEAVGERTIVVEACRFFSLLYLNNNLHIVHHASPSMAWYDLPALYRERREQFLAANNNYLFPGYWAIVRRFAFRSKQPVAHPFLHRVGGEPAAVPVEAT